MAVNSTIFSASGGGIKCDIDAVLRITANLSLDGGTATAGSTPTSRRTLIVTCGSDTLGSNTSYMPASQADIAAMNFSTIHLAKAGDVIYLKAFHAWGFDLKCRMAFGMGCDLSVELVRAGMW